MLSTGRKAGQLCHGDCGLGHWTYCGWASEIHHQFGMVETLKRCLPSINWWLGFRWPNHSIADNPCRFGFSTQDGPLASQSSKFELDLCGSSCTTSLSHGLCVTAVRWLRHLPDPRLHIRHGAHNPHLKGLAEKRPNSWSNTRRLSKWQSSTQLSPRYPGSSPSWSHTCLHAWRQNEL